jgi:hypothetical protein
MESTTVFSNHLEERAFETSTLNVMFYEEFGARTTSCRRLEATDLLLSTGVWHEVCS